MDNVLNCKDFNGVVRFKSLVVGSAYQVIENKRYKVQNCQKWLRTLQVFYLQLVVCGI